MLPVQRLVGHLTNTVSQQISSHRACILYPIADLSKRVCRFAGRLYGNRL